MKAGQMIRLRAYGGQELVRRIVQVNRTHVAVCTESEFVSAQRERREPLTVGFPVTDVLEVVKSDAT